MSDNVTPFPRHGIEGFYSAADLPQDNPVGDCAYGTGWSELDRLLKFYDQQLIIITGKPGHGKSTLVLNLICNLARLHGVRTLLYAPESERMIVEQAKTIWNDPSTVDYFLQHQLFIQSSQPAEYPNDCAQTLDWLLSKADDAIRSEHIELVVIDPWNELEGARPKDMLVTDYIAGCLQMCKRFVRAYGITLIIVAHPTKAAADPDRVPTLADIEGSMNWWNKADNGLVVSREHATNTCCVISAKVRFAPHAGMTGMQRFSIDAPTGIMTPMVGAAAEFQPQKPSGRRKRWDDLD